MTKFVISHFLKYCFAIFDDRSFKFYTQLKREEYKRFVYTMAHKPASVLLSDAAVFVAAVAALAESVSHMAVDTN